MREMQIRTISRYLVTVVRMVTIRNLDSVGVDVEKRESSYTVYENEN